MTCRFGGEHALYRSAARSFDGLALSAAQAGLLAVFSDAAGLFVEALDAQGRARGSQLRIGARCGGGLAALWQREQLQVACLRPSVASEPLKPAVTLYTLGADVHVTAEQHFGVARRLSQGVALAADAHGLHCAWQDASVGESRVWVATLTAGSATPAVLSDPAYRAGSPSLCEHRGAVVAAWAELQPQAVAPVGRVMARALAGDAAAVMVTSVRDAVSSPSVVSVAGQLVVAFRDRRSRGRKTGLYLLRLDDGLGPVGRAVRVARADGVAQPSVQACAGAIIAATPRTFAGDYFVGVVQVAAKLDRMSGEQQFYEDSHEFAQAAAACTPGGALLLIAERGMLGRPGAALRSVPFGCR
ncbi:MAG TPA: hypothetical protein VF331_21050 [Polyangiales bacterium]